MSTLISPIVVKFSSNDFNQIPGMLITNRGDLQPGERKLSQFKLARTNKSVLTAAEFVSKPITIAFVITRPSRAQLRESIDMLNGFLTDMEGVLDILQDGVIRRYTATLKALTITESTGGFARGAMSFIASDPFGYDADPTVLLDSMVDTTGNTAYQILIGGSFAVEPTFTVTVTAVTGGTNAFMSLFNTQSGIGITVTRDWQAGDELVIDGREQSVRINGAEFLATGKMPSFPPGLRQLGLIDSFTTRSTTTSAVYTKRYQ